MTEDENKRDLLLCAIALAVQNTEALSDYWKRQPELLGHISQRRREMIQSFYSNGYFVPAGPSWEQFCVDFHDAIGWGIGNDSDGSDQHDPEQRTVTILHPLAQVNGPMEIVLDACVFLIAFDRAER